MLEFSKRFGYLYELMCLGFKGWSILVFAKKVNAYSPVHFFAFHPVTPGPNPEFTNWG